VAFPFFLKFLINEYNLSTQNFNVAVVDCSYSKVTILKTVYQKFKKEIILRENIVHNY